MNRPTAGWCAPSARGSIIGQFRERAVVAGRHQGVMDSWVEEPLGRFARRECELDNPREVRARFDGAVTIEFGEL